MRTLCFPWACRDFAAPGMNRRDCAKQGGFPPHMPPHGPHHGPGGFAHGPRLSREAQYGNGALGRRHGGGSKHMAAEEIEQILRIQWKSLHSGSPYHEDYYYQVCPLSCSIVMLMAINAPRTCMPPSSRSCLPCRIKAF